MGDWAQRASAEHVCVAFATIYPRLVMLLGVDEELIELSEAVRSLRGDLRHKRTG
jgi:hypothetical protein